MTLITTYNKSLSPWLHRIFFIGVIFHEITHHLLLSLFDFEVTEYQLYSTNNTAEYITYQGKMSTLKIICVNYAPILLTIISIIYCLLFWDFIASTPLLASVHGYIITANLIYGYPSTYDIQSVKEYTQTQNIQGSYTAFIKITQKIITIYERLLPLILIIFVSSFGYMYFII